MLFIPEPQDYRLLRWPITMTRSRRLPRVFGRPLKDLVFAFTIGSMRTRPRGRMSWLLSQWSGHDS